MSNTGTPSAARARGRGIGFRSRITGWRWGHWGAATLALLGLCASLPGASPATRAANGNGPIEVVVHRVGADKAPVREAASGPVRLYQGQSVLLELVEPATGRPLPIIRAAAGLQDVAEALAVTPKQVQVIARGRGTTDVILWAEDGRHRIVELIVTQPVDDRAAQLDQAIRKHFPTARVEAHFLLDTVVLTGTVPSAEMAEQIVQIAEIFAQDLQPVAEETEMVVQPSGGTQQQGGGKKEKPKVKNLMRVAGGNQVLLRCAVAEVSKSATRQLGVNGWLAGDNLHDVFAVNQIGGINNANIGGAAEFGPIGGPHAGPIPFATDRDVGLPLMPRMAYTGPTLSLGFPRVQMQLFFQAMRENGLLRVLAEPNLVAVAGQEASFLAGGEIPVPVPQSSGGSVTITIEWREFGVRLRFLPTPVGRDMIRLRVCPEVSELDFATGTQIQGTVVPGLTQRRAETTIELPSGSTIAIAGLLSERVRATAQKVPGLGDVPVLGALFSSVEYQKDQTELVILVTPELVDAMNPDQVPPVPGQFMTDPNDWQLFGLGLLEGEPEPDPPAARDQAVKTDLPPLARKWTAPPTQMSLHGPWGPADENEKQ